MTDTPLEIYVLAAFLIEAVVNLLLTVYTPPPSPEPWWKGLNVKVILAIVVGELIGFGFRLDLFAAVGFVGEWWLGVFITGLMISRGSNFLHDLLQFVRNLKQKAAADAELNRSITTDGTAMK